MTTNLESFKWWASHTETLKKLQINVENQLKTAKGSRDDYFIWTLSEFNRISQSQKWERDG